MHYRVEYILRKLKERQFRQLKFKHAALNGSEAQNAESPNFSVLYFPNTRSKRLKLILFYLLEKQHH